MYLKIRFKILNKLLSDKNFNDNSLTTGRLSNPSAVQFYEEPQIKRTNASVLFDTKLLISIYICQLARTLHCFLSN